MTTPRRPPISVVLATYNHGTFVTAAIESVLDQTFPRSELEIIVVDDGSTDDTRARLDRYGDAIRYIHKENGGQASAWNVGLAQSRGEIIAFLDSDDTWYRDKLVQVVGEFEKSPAVDVVSHRLTVINDRGLAIGEAPEFSTHPAGEGDRRPLQNYLQGKPAVLPPTSGIAVRSACLARLAPIPEEFCGGSRGPGPDLFLAYLLPFYAREFFFIPRPLGNYRIHGLTLREDDLVHQGGLGNAPPTAQHTEATLQSYRLIWTFVERAAREQGHDCSVLRRKFEAMAREAEIHLYSLRHERRKALQLAVRYADPEFQATLPLRAFRRISLILDVLLPRGVYLALRGWYRQGRFFELVHRRRALPVEDEPTSGVRREPQ